MSNFPKPTGPFAVGQTVLDSHWLTFLPSTHDETARPLPQVRLWYPADPASPAGSPWRRAWFSARRTLYGGGADAALSERPLAPGEWRFPVLLYHPGWPGTAVDNHVLIEGIAAQGYVVAALTYPARLPHLPKATLAGQRRELERPMDYSSEAAYLATVESATRRVRTRAADGMALLDAFAQYAVRVDGSPDARTDASPGGRYDAGTIDASPDSRSDPRTIDPSPDSRSDPRTIDPSPDSRSDPRTIDASPALCADAPIDAGTGAQGVAAQLARRLDLERVGIMGFSLGGAVAAETSTLDSRIRAVVNVDGRHWGTALETGVAPPYLVIGEELLQPTAEDLAAAHPDRRYNALLDRYDYSQLAKNLRRNGGIQVVIHGTLHLNFTDSALRRRLRKQPDTGTIDAARALEILGAYVLAFFEQALRGRPSPLLQPSANAYPEASISVWQRPASPAPPQLESAPGNGSESAR